MTHLPPKINNSNSNTHEFDTYNEDVQKYFLACWLEDANTFNDTRHIIKDEYFDDTMRRSVRFILQHHEEYGTIPDRALINAKTGIDIPLISTYDPSFSFNRDWFLTEIEKFCRHKAIENTLLSGMDDLFAGNVNEIKQRMDEAYQISLHKENGPFKRYKWTDLAARPRPEWLFRNLLFERQIGMVYGKPGSCKSFLLLALSSLLTNGLTWQGETLDRKRVIYIAGEGDTLMESRRLAWGQHHRIKPHDDGLDMVAVPVDLTDTASVTLFINEMKKDPDNIGLVVFDTLSKCVAGQNENAPEVMTGAIKGATTICRALDAAGLIVHHPGKDEARGARGHSSNLADVDTMWRVDRSDKAMSLTVTVEKQKDGIDGITFNFDATLKHLGIFDKKGNEWTSLVITEGEHKEAIGETISAVEADRITIASMIPLDMPLPLSDVIEYVRGKTLLGGRDQTRERIEAAIPFNQPVTSRTTKGVIELTRTQGAVNNAKLIRARLIAE